MKPFVVRNGPNPEIFLPTEKKTVKAWLRKAHKSSHKKSVTALALGDYVECELQTQGSDTIAVIHEVYPPDTMIVRESVRYPNRKKIIASNLDQAFIILSAKHPRTAWGMIDRLTVAILSGKIHPIILINKWDDQPDEKEDKEFLDETIRIYKPIFPLYTVSAHTGYQIPELASLLEKKKSIFIGISGVGKTALVKAITGKELRTGSISDANKKGTHTTRDSILHPIDDSSWIADVPGIKQLGFIQTDDPLQYFPELYNASLHCKFSNCKHNNEPGCNVQACLQNGTIDIHRLESYKKLKDELEPDYFKERQTPEEKKAPRQRIFGSLKKRK